MSGRQPFTEWQLPSADAPQAGDLFEVVMRTVRDARGVLYEVGLGLRSLNEGMADHVGGVDNEAQAWLYYVPFGQTDATVAGGSAFVATARRQQEVADKWARTIE